MDDVTDYMVKALESKFCLSSPNYNKSFRTKWLDPSDETAYDEDKPDLCDLL